MKEALTVWFSVLTIIAVFTFIGYEFIESLPPAPCEKTETC